MTILLKPKLLLVVILLIACSAVVTPQNTEPLQAAWVKEDIDGIAMLLKFLPFENQTIPLVKARLKDTWSVEEADFGFGGKRLDLGKGNGYTKMFVEAFLFNGQVACFSAKPLMLLKKRANSPPLGSGVPATPLFPPHAFLSSARSITLREKIRST